MPKETTYTFKGEFEVTYDGNGLGEFATVDAFMSAFRRSRRWSRLVTKGKLDKSTKNLPPNKDWGTRFHNRLYKAIDLMDGKDWNIPNHYDVTGRILTDKVPDICCRLTRIGSRNIKFGIVPHCSKEDCPSHKYKGNHIWSDGICSFGPDYKNGDMVVTVSDKGLELLKEIGIVDIPSETIVGNLKDKDAVQTIKDTLISIQNLFGSIKFHD